MFATAIDADAADQLRRAADEMAWLIDNEFDTTEYERDVLVATAAPAELEPGADRLWFIPSHLRSVFTSRFFRYLMTYIADEGLLSPPDTSPWHLDLVRADQHDRRDEVRDRLDHHRTRAGKAAARPLVDRIDTSKIGRLASTDDILVALGAGPDGRIEIDDLPGPGTQARRADDTYWLRHRWTVLITKAGLPTHSSPISCSARIAYS